MNILYHFRVRGSGAEGVHIAGIADGFRAAGHRVRFVSPTNANPCHPFPPNPDSNPAPAPQCPTHSPHPDNSQSIARSKRARLLHLSADHAPQLFFELMEMGYGSWGRHLLSSAIRSERPDLIYERYAFFNDAGAVISKRFNIPLIVEVNELSGYQRVRGQIFTKKAQCIEKRIFQQATLIVAISAFLEKRIASMLGDDRKILRLPNGVSQAWLNIQPNQNTVSELRRSLHLEGRQVIGFIGGLVHWHRFDLLLKAVSLARNRMHNNMAILFVGDGRERENIESMAHELGLDDSIFFAGNIPYLKVRDYLALFDVAMIPHSNEFRSPLKLFEYMGAGLAVLAPAVQPIRAVIENDIDGILFEPDQADQAADALTRLLSNPAIRQTLGSKAREKILANYTWEHLSRQILDRFANQ